MKRLIIVFTLILGIVIDANAVLTSADLLDGKYLLVQQGKKKYFLLIAK